MLRLVNNSVEYINFDNFFKQIEYVARTCYKSEDKITETSSREFVTNLIKRGHTAMLEHGTVYLVFDRDNEDLFNFYQKNPYSEVKNYDDKHVYVTTNFRVIVENDLFNNILYEREPIFYTSLFDNEPIYHFERHTFKIITDRAVSHELVRHRVFSFAQESQRYCNYTKDKFGNCITFIIPSVFEDTLKPGVYDKVDGEWFLEGENINSDLKKEEKVFLDALNDSSNKYFKLISEGFTPQIARMVLPNATKTEICMTGFKYQWKNFLDLRYHESTGKVHPDMKSIASKIYNKLDEIDS